MVRYLLVGAATLCALLVAPALSHAQDTVLVYFVNTEDAATTVATVGAPPGEKPISLPMRSVTQTIYSPDDKVQVKDAQGTKVLKEYTVGADAVQTVIIGEDGRGEKFKGFTFRNNTKSTLTVKGVVLTSFRAQLDPVTQKPMITDKVVDLPVVTTIQPGIAVAIGSPAGMPKRFVAFDEQNRPVQVFIAKPGAQTDSFTFGAEAGANWYDIDQPDPSNLQANDDNQTDYGSDADTRKIPTLFHSRGGYNVPKMHPFDYQQKGLLAGNVAIFDDLPNASRKWYAAAGFRVPNEYLFLQLNDAADGMQSQMFFTESERQDGFSINLGLSGGLGDEKKAGANSSTKGGYSQTRTNLDSNKSVYMYASKWESAFWLTMLKSRIRLSAGFKARVRQLPLTEDLNAYSAFFDGWGTHYPLSTLYGGRCYKEEYLSEDKVLRSFESSFDISREASANIDMLKVGTSAGFGSKSSDKSISESEFKSITVQKSGGDGSTFEFWQLNDPSKYVPIRLELRPIYELLRPELFQGDTSLSQSDYEEINQKYLIMQKMYDRYLNAPSTLAAETGAPVLFGVKVLSVQCTYFNDGTTWPYLYGTQTVGGGTVAGGKTLTKLGTPKVWTLSRDNAVKVTETSPTIPATGAEECVVAVSPLDLIVSANPSANAPIPVIYLSANFWDADYSLGNTDDGAGRGDQWIEIPALLADLNSAPSVTRELEFKDEEENTRVKLQIRRLGYRMSSSSGATALPNMPDWRSPSASPISDDIRSFATADGVFRRVAGKTDQWEEVANGTTTAKFTYTEMREDSSYVYLKDQGRDGVWLRVPKRDGLLLQYSGDNGVTFSDLYPGTLSRD